MASRRIPNAARRLTVDEGPHNMDGMLLHARYGFENVEAFISRRVVDIWVEPMEPRCRRQSLYRAQYNALGKLNLAAIERIVATKYERGAAFNRQHPFVDISPIRDVRNSENKQSPRADQSGRQ